MLQFITHHTDRLDTFEGAAAALEGGCRWVQLRMKDAPAAQIVDTARRLRTLCDRYGAKLILDDHAQLVAQTGADGVHLGKNDMPVTQARALLGPDIIIGTTANTLQDMVKAAGDGADYIGLGPYRFTVTKQKLSPVLGLDGYSRLMSAFRQGHSLPVVAIGGITLDDVDALMQTGISGVAVSGAITGATDPVATTRGFVQKTINI